MKIKPLEEIVTKWTNRVAIASPEYEAGVRNPKRDWAAEAAAANDTWKAEMQDAIARNAFLAGVRTAGTAKWQAKTISVGLTRWAPGVAVAAPDYKDGFAPFHSALAALVLPPRRGRSTPQNYDRAKKVGEALHKVRLGLLKR